jgi:hypothetical protein
MKKNQRNTIIFLLVLLGIGALLFILLSKTSILQTREQSPDLPAENHAVKPITKSPTSNTDSPDTVKQREETRRMGIVRRFISGRTIPIEFYGRVLDQHEKPVSGVKVMFEISSAKMPLTSFYEVQRHVENPVRYSDERGYFSLNGFEGSNLFLKLEKKGYRTEGRWQAHTPKPGNSNALQYIYHGAESHRFKPNASSPEIFHIWEKAPRERLLREGFRAGISRDGTPVNLDFKRDIVESGGNLRVSLRQNPIQNDTGGKYEWTVKIESLNGGLVLANEQYLFLAPESGYLKEFVFTMPVDAPKWDDVKEFYFYVKLNDGTTKYGRLYIDLMTDVRDNKGFLRGSIRGSFLYNPSGSRVLE